MIKFSKENSAASGQAGGGMSKIGCNELLTTDKHYLHNRRFSVSAIHGKATWIDVDGTLYVKFRHHGEDILLPMEQRFREHGDESRYWNVFGRWRIDEYLHEADLDTKAGEIGSGTRIHTDARG